MEQLESQLPAADVTLNTEILDRIDELVAPGVTLNAEDNSYGAAELAPCGAPTAKDMSQRLTAGAVNDRDDRARSVRIIEEPS